MGISKVAAFHTTKYFRQAHGLYAANGILFNHESPRRGLNFVTRKITHSLARILSGMKKKLHWVIFQQDLRLGSLKRLCKRNLDDITA